MAAADPRRAHARAVVVGAGRIGARRATRRGQAPGGAGRAPPVGGEATPPVGGRHHQRRLCDPAVGGSVARRSHHDHPGGPRVAHRTVHDGRGERAVHRVDRQVHHVGPVVGGPADAGGHVGDLTPAGARRRRCSPRRGPAPRAGRPRARSSPRCRRRACRGRRRRRRCRRTRSGHPRWRCSRCRRGTPPREVGVVEVDARVDDRDRRCPDRWPLGPRRSGAPIACWSHRARRVELSIGPRWSGAVRSAAHAAAMATRVHPPQRGSRRSRRSTCAFCRAAARCDRRYRRRMTVTTLPNTVTSSGGTPCARGARSPGARWSGPAGRSSSWPRRRGCRRRRCRPARRSAGSGRPRSRRRGCRPRSSTRPAPAA